MKAKACNSGRTNPGSLCQCYSTVWAFKQMDGRTLPIWQWMEVEISVKGEAIISKIELINKIHICGLSVRNWSLFDLMLGRTRGADLFENGVGYVLVGDQCKRWRMIAPPEPFDTLVRTVSSVPNCIIRAELCCLTKLLFLDLSSWY